MYIFRLERLSDTDINIEEYMKMLGMSMHSGDDLNMSMHISKTPTSKSSTSAALGVTEEEEEEAENRGNISAMVPAINEEDIGGELGALVSQCPPVFIYFLAYLRLSIIHC